MINEEFASFANMRQNTMIEAYRLALAPWMRLVRLEVEWTYQDSAGGKNCARDPDVKCMLTEKALKSDTFCHCMRN